MKTRVITGTVLFVLLVLICIFSNIVVFPIVIAFLSVLGVYEINKCMGSEKNLFLGIPLYLIALAVPFLLRYVDKKTIYNFLPKAVFIILLLFFYVLGVLVFSKGKYKLQDTIASFATSLYIIGAISSIQFLRDAENGKYLWIFIFLGAWITDTFAYFSGVLFGKHKLIPDVSPKKTVEGSIGGIVFCAIFFVGYALVLKFFFDVQINIWLTGLIGLIVSIISQIGDLSMSVIKRNYGVKDYGKIFPGHGGVLDRFDSIMAVSLTLAFLTRIINIFG